MDADDIGNNDPKINELLEQLSTSRSELSKYMTDVDGLRKNVDDIFPKSQDFRNKFVLEEKIKAASSFYSTLLNIRQEFNKTIKEEIEIRRRLQPKTAADQVLDIREAARLIEEHDDLDQK